MEPPLIALSSQSPDEEEEHPVRYIQLTPQYRMAIRAIRKVSGERVPTGQFCIMHDSSQSDVVCPYMYKCLARPCTPKRRPYPLTEWLVKLDEVPCGPTQIQGGSQAIRRQRRHWTVLSWSRWSPGASESITSEVTALDMTSISYLFNPLSSIIIALRVYKKDIKQQRFDDV